MLISHAELCAASIDLPLLDFKASECAIWFSQIPLFAIIPLRIPKFISKLKQHTAILIFHKEEPITLPKKMIHEIRSLIPPLMLIAN